MKKSLLLVIVLFSPTLLVTQETKVSSSPLSSEQLAVYRAFLRQRVNEHEISKINLSDITEPLIPNKDDFASCMKGFTKGKNATEIHSLLGSGLENKTIHLVDAKTHQQRDPGDAIHSGESVDNAVQRGFEEGLLSLSEVIFSPDGKMAALNYGFRCGSLCGNGGTIIFQKTNGSWKRSKRNCGYWIS